MRNRLLSVLVGLLISCPAGAQVIDVNTDILKMIQQGLPESVVVRKIQENIGHWDTSTDALIALKKVGATEAELNAIMGPVPEKKSVPPQTIPEMPVAKFLGGDIQRTTTGDPVLVFPTTTRMTFPDGRLSGSAYLVTYKGEPAFLIPTTSFQDGGCGVENVILLKEKLVFDRYLIGTCVEDPTPSTATKKGTDLLEETRDGLKLETEKTFSINPFSFSLNNQQFKDLKIPHEKLVGGTPNKRADKKKTMNDDVIFGVFLPYQYDKMELPPLRAAMLDPFLQRLMNNFDATLGDFLKVAGVINPAVQLSMHAAYVRVSPESGDEYAAVLRQAYRESKRSGGGLLSFMNTMQGISNMQTAMTQAKAADAAHDGLAQMRATTNALTAEVQTLNSVSNPNAAPIQPLGNTSQPGVANQSGSPSTPGSLASGPTISGVGMYVGPNAEWVQRVLATAGPYICSPSGKIKTPVKFSCQRDGEVYKAQLLAWGSECSEQTGSHEDAVSDAEIMMQTLHAAKLLCGAQAPTGAVRCDTDRILSCSQLP